MVLPLRIELTTAISGVTISKAFRDAVCVWGETFSIDSAVRLEYKEINVNFSKLSPLDKIFLLCTI